MQILLVFEQHLSLPSPPFLSFPFLSFHFCVKIKHAIPPSKKSPQTNPPHPPTPFSLQNRHPFPPPSTQHPHMPPPLRDPPLCRPPLHNPRQQTFPSPLPTLLSFPLPLPHPHTTISPHIPHPHTTIPPRNRSIPRSLSLITVTAHGDPSRHNALARTGRRAIVVLARGDRVST